MFKAPGQSNPQYVLETSAIEPSIYSRDLGNRIHKMFKGLGQSNPQYLQGTRAVKSTIYSRDQGSKNHNMLKGSGELSTIYVQGTRTVKYIIANSVLFHYLDCSAAWQVINGRCVQSLTIGKNLADSKVSATVV